MDLFGSSKVEDSVSSSVKRVENRKEDVEVDQFRSNQELIDRVDRLEKTVESLRARLEEILGEDSEESAPDISSVIDNRLSQRIEKPNHITYEFDDVEARLEMLEMAVSRLESGFEMSADELREEVLRDAFDFEDTKFNQIEDRVTKVENKVENIEEGIDRSEFKDLQAKVEEMSKILLELTMQQNNLKI